ncbi:hypothetical protein D0T51_09580 [Parabacteroides sp. 52]|uniref:hypothetical protein n=1 Tax=unclassified Parabacteroides TaxID=2649774 RepID=UPI0013D6947E|nr:MULTISPECIES: hypothetical protein [unclassified Parabacteroides]MDH6535398.1 hypothetical protein [Parabacteroides sp. PM5-20]NDV55975.1 hypothetical protein [Parabacteroides sp. 52]
MSVPASEDSLKLLVQNCKGAIKDLENIFPAMMKLRISLTEIRADDIEYKDTIIAFLSKTEDLLLGSNFILHELMSSLRFLPETTFIYEKRYHIQNINLSLCEAYSYFLGNKNDGVWSLLKPMILALNNSSLNSYVVKIDNELAILGKEHCDVQMRHSTAHYDQPIERYKKVNNITEEDKYCKATSKYLLIHMHISQVSMIITDIIKRIVPKNVSSSIKPMIPAFDIKAFVEENIAIKLSSDERIAYLSSESLIKTSNSIDSLYKNHLMCEGAEKFIASKNIKSATNIEALHKLIMLRMMIGFIHCDLTCSIRAYMNSKSRVERSLHLRRIYVTEVSGLTYLYGYNKEKNAQSLWQQLMNMDINGDRDGNENKKESLRKKLEELTSSLNSPRRNLYIHFREYENLNILKRYEAYEELNQLDEVKRALNLIHLCKEIDNYTIFMLKQVEIEEQQKSKDQMEKRHAMFEDLRYKMTNSKLSETMKAQAISIIDEMERKITKMFDPEKIDNNEE